MIDPRRPDARRCPIASVAHPARRPRAVVATLALVAASYLACAAAATYPVVLTFGSELPGQLTDPLEHLWLMRWSGACLLEGKSPVFCPDLNAPTGVPLGYFPTMHVQTGAFLLMGLVTGNDVARFNAIWFTGFAATGLGTFALAWWAVRAVGPAWLAGLGAMLCGPMLMHAHGHLETMQMGAVPPFLVAWIRFVDAPGRGRLLVAAGLYLLVVACAPYFAVLAVFPAAWYAAWSVAIAGSGSRLARLKARSGWLVGFAAVVLPGLAVLFLAQGWAAAHGFPMARTRAQFDQFGAPPWSTFVPSPLHALGRLGGVDPFATAAGSSRMSECSSYLGVVTLGLLAYAAGRRLAFPRAGYWWSVLALMVVLSWGSRLDLGGVKVGLPAGWIYGVFPPFHLIRVPARFNLFAAVCAAVPASAALADLGRRVRLPAARALLAAACAGVMLADLAMVPFQTSVIPPLPTAYRELAHRNPAASLVDAPMFGSNEGQVFSSLWGYWQAAHRLRTTAGYPGLPNAVFEAEVVRPSPFWAARWANPEYPEGTTGRFGAADGVDPRDYAWLYLTAHGFDHVVIHQGTWTDPRFAAGGERIKRLLAEARASEDADVAVFDRARLAPPRRLAWLCGAGFRPRLAKGDDDRPGVLREGRVVAFDPTPGRPVVLELVGASAFGRGRVVRLVEGDRELGRWAIRPGAPGRFETPPFRLDAGMRELRLISDGDDRPTRSVDRLDDARTPYALRVEGVRMRPVDGDR